nr:xylulose kinase-1 [Tanacetum cinerariifolium]
MSLTFADTHNMVAYLNKSDASEGFDQVIDFLNASYIKYALTINPHIYVLCIKQFWNTVVIKQSNDVTRLQALVDKKKVVITEATIRDVLRLDDAEGVDCLPNEDIFVELARIGQKFNFSKYIFESLVKNVYISSKFYMYPRVGKGFPGVETPLFEGMLVAGELEEQGDAEEQVQDDVDNVVAQRDDTTVPGDDVHVPSIPSPTPPTLPPQQSQDLPSTSQEALDACATLARRVEHLEYDKVAQVLEITKLKRRVKQLERGNNVKGRMIDESDRDEGRQAEIYQIDMDHASKVLSMHEDEPEVHEVVDVVTTAKLITDVVTAASESVTAASTTIAAAEDPEEESTVIIPVDTKSKDKGKGIMLEVPKPMKKKQQVEMDEEYARKLHKELNKDIDWDVTIDHVKQKAKEDPYVQRYLVMKKRPQTEAQARRNMMMYLKNVVGFRLDYFKGMSYDDIPKRRKLNEEVEDLKQHLEIVPDEDDDVYTEATPLERKVPVVDYEIIHFNNKPHYKIIRADGTHQLWTSSSLEESNDCPWSSKVERRYPWKSQRSVHGQAKVKSWKLLESCGVHIITFTTTQLILLVERRYTLSRFTLDQMLNAVRLRVEEQSEMSLELLRFTRQQHQEGQLE